MYIYSYSSTCHGFIALSPNLYHHTPQLYYGLRYHPINITISPYNLICIVTLFIVPYHLICITITVSISITISPYRYLLPTFPMYFPYRFPIPVNSLRLQPFPGGCHQVGWDFVVIRGEQMSAQFVFHCEPLTTKLTNARQNAAVLLGHVTPDLQEKSH